MAFTIFYSWQSDLPNKFNRSFIEDCLKKAIKDIKKDISLEIVIDRDTRGLAGTPDIVKAIFEKIDKADAFIADISIINSDSVGRKTPNPNVLFELGYATNRIDWSNVICIFNTTSGSIESLPFDIKFRRPLTYELDEKSNKSKVKTDLIEQLKISLISTLHHRERTNEFIDFIKYQIDTELLSICNNLIKLLHNYSIPFSEESVSSLLTYDHEKIQYELHEKKILGFPLLRDWSEHFTNLNNILNQPMVIQKATNDMQSAIISLLKALDSLIIISGKSDFFVDVSQERIEGYRITHGRDFNASNPANKYIFTIEIDDEHSKVLDAAYIKQYNLRYTANQLSISNHWIERYIEIVSQIIKSINRWLDLTNGEFIVDEKMFRMRFNAANVQSSK